MGRYLRRFWHPVFRSADLLTARPVPVQLLGEHLTLYRDEDNLPHLLADRCAHQGSPLSTGSVEGDRIRCHYHGWAYDSAGQCVDAPGESERFASAIRIASYPVVERYGLVFVRLSEDAPPDPPRIPILESGGRLDARAPTVWPCNYFHRIANTADFSHTFSAHRTSGVGHVFPAFPVPQADETAYGVHLRTRDNRNGDLPEVHYIMPNVFLYKSPVEGLDAWYPHLTWYVPTNGETTTTFHVVHIPSAFESRSPSPPDPRIPTLPHRNDTLNIAEKILAGELRLEDVRRHPNLVDIEDYVAVVGQSRRALRPSYMLGRSDAALSAILRIWKRELRAMARGKLLKNWASRVESLSLP